MKRQVNLLCILFATSNNLPSRPSALIVVNAKLVLWPEQDEEEYLTNHLDRTSRKSRKSTRKNAFEAQHSSSIRDRLRLFNHDEDKIHVSESNGYTPYPLSPVRYLSLMIRYLQNQITDLSTHLYSNTSSPWSAYSLFRRTQYNNMIAEPKDAWEGLLSAFAALRTGYVRGMQYLVDGVYEFGCSSITACTALLPSGSGRDYAPISKFVTEFAFGVSRGAENAKDAVLLFAAGALVGARNLAVGIARTPEAIRSSRMGMLYFPTGRKDNSQHSSHGQVAVWDYYSLDSEDREILLEEERLNIEADSPKINRKSESLRKRRRHSPVKDSKLYDILGVSTNANAKEIRSAYRREALRHHPDKQQAYPTSVMDESTMQSSSVEGFLDLTEAYRILSNDDTRDAYDEYGVCYKSHNNNAFQAEGAHDLISELFGADAVKDYVGNVEIASIVNELFGFSSVGDAEAASEEIKNLRQRRRVVDIAKYLRDKVGPFVRGEITEEQFTLDCKKEVEFILKDGGDIAFAAVIGRTLVQEADRRLGHVLPFVKRFGTDFAQVVSSKVAGARVYGPIYFRVALEGLLSGLHYDSNDTDPGDCSSDSRSNRHPVDQNAILDLLWKYIVNDTVVALRDACDKVFADHGVRDSSLAFVKTQPLLMNQKAIALKALGRQFLAAAEQGRK